jgi:hypothetical protein
MDKKWQESMQETLDLTTNNMWHDVYSYKALTNSFTITVSGSDVSPLGWFGKQRSIIKQYQQGDAFNM